MSRRRIKKHMFKIDVPRNIAPEMFAMMFGTSIQGVTVALSNVEEGSIIVACPRHLKVNVRRLAKQCGVKGELAFKKATRSDWGGDRAGWIIDER